MLLRSSDKVSIVGRSNYKVENTFLFFVQVFEFLNCFFTSPQGFLLTFPQVLTLQLGVILEPSCTLPPQPVSGSLIVPAGSPLFPQASLSPFPLSPPALSHSEDKDNNLLTQPSLVSSAAHPKPSHSPWGAVNSLLKIKIALVNPFLKIFQWVPFSF